VITNDTLLRSLEARLAPALDLLQQMVAINSHTLNPAGIRQLGEFTASAFAGLGFRAEFIPSVKPGFGAHLVLTRKGGGAATVGLISHLDTVYSAEEEARNDFHWRVEGDRIYGPGTDDIKGGTMMMHLVLSTLRELAPEVFERTNWVLLLDASEEVDSADFGRLSCERLRGAKAALVFEGGRQNANAFKFVASRKGRATFRVEVEGRGAHAGSEHPRGANAITQLAHTVQRIASLTDPACGVTLNVGTISGGTALNRVPHIAVACAELRAFTPKAYQAALKKLRELEQDIVERSVEGGFPCQVRVVIESETPPWPRNDATDALLNVFAAAGAELGFTISREDRGGLSDANLIWSAVPTIDGLGPKGDNSHCSERSADGSKDQEYIERSAIVPKAALNVRALLQLLS
jgi:glutamate carboxypeptidase